MPNLAEPDIATCNQIQPSWLPNDSEGISTEPQQRVDPSWEECNDALLKLWRNPQRLDDGLVTPPGQSAIDSAIRWLNYMRRHTPDFPPTGITAEPAGGIIMEWHKRSTDGRHEFIRELTIYNGLTAELTFHRDGRVVRMDEVNASPPKG